MTPLIWIPGGRGMVGQALCQHLDRLGLRYRATGSEVDIADAAAVMAYAQAHSPTHIINAAAMTQVDACETEIDRARRVNGEGPRHLALAARQLGAQALHISTDYVFAGRTGRPFDEQDPVAPASQYGISKLLGEQQFMAVLEGSGLTHHVVRTSWVFGPGGQNFVRTMLQLMKERDQVSVVVDQKGRPTYAPHLAEALLRLMGLMGERGASATGLYHFANSNPTSWHGLCCEVRTAAQSLGLALACQTIEPVTSDKFVRPAPRPAYSVLSTAKFEQATGFVPAPYQAAVHDYVRTLSGTPH